MSYRLTRALVTLWRRRLSSVSPNGPPGNRSGRSLGLWRPAAFTILVGATSYSASAIYAEELKISWTRRKRHWREVVKGEGGMLQKIRRWWLRRNSADRFIITVVALNTGVFLLWRVPRLHLLMEKYFIASTANRSSWPLLLSSFSHIEFWHVVVNMLVLWSFAPTLLQTLGDRVIPLNTWPYYLTGGVFASMVGHYAKLMRGTRVGSLGASGAIMAVVALVVFNNPDSRVFIIFMPFFPIPANWALAGVVSLDLLGLVRGWQFFDHAGHLGGVLFAVLYQWWLQRALQKVQARAGRSWHRVRSSPADSGGRT